VRATLECPSNSFFWAGGLFGAKQANLAPLAAAACPAFGVFDGLPSSTGSFFAVADMPALLILQPFCKELSSDDQRGEERGEPLLVAVTDSVEAVVDSVELAERALASCSTADEDFDESS